HTLQWQNLNTSEGTRIGALILVIAPGTRIGAQTRAPPRADSSFCSSAYGVLAALSSCCSPPKGRFLRVTHPSATGNTTSRPTCMCKACRQRSS
ncbi:hypothetical protein Lal_00035451, partial [Lupinus albus]